MCNLKGQPSYVAWVDGLAKKDCRKVPDVIEIALKRYAEHIGADPPPSRLGSKKESDPS